jgi:hypothetical protein
MYRHRGHRFITIRSWIAPSRISRTPTAGRGKPDAVEPDGLPNARSIPTSTLQSNPYHLGLAHFLKGDFEQAAASMRGVAPPGGGNRTCWWRQAMALQACAGWAGRGGGSRPSPDHRRAPGHRNGSYHRLLLMYKGSSPIHCWRPGWDRSRRHLAYGVGGTSATAGRAGARDLPEDLESPQWAAFGYATAEAEVAENVNGEP